MVYIERVKKADKLRYWEFAGQCMTHWHLMHCTHNACCAGHHYCAVIMAATEGKNPWCNFGLRH